MVVEYQNSHESNDEVTHVDHREQADLRSRPRRAGEPQIRENRCQIANDPSLYDVQSRLEQDDSGGAAGSVLERNATSVDLHVGGNVHRVLGQ